MKTLLDIDYLLTVMNAGNILKESFNSAASQTPDAKTVRKIYDNISAYLRDADNSGLIDLSALVANGTWINQPYFRSGIDSQGKPWVKLLKDTPSPQPAPGVSGRAAGKQNNYRAIFTGAVNLVQNRAQGQLAKSVRLDITPG